MRCPRCKSPDTGVYKTTDTDREIARQRHCKSCKGRWYTDERVRRGSYVVITDPTMTKSNGSEQEVIINNSKNLSESDQASSKPSDARAMEPPVFQGLPLCETGKTWDVPADFDREIAAAFPAQPRQAVYAEIRLWLVANPTKRKTLRGMPKFIAAWFGRRQDKGVTGPALVSSVPRLDPRCLHHAKGWTSRPKELQSGCPVCDQQLERERATKAASVRRLDEIQAADKREVERPTMEQLKALRGAQ